MPKPDLSAWDYVDAGGPTSPAVRDIKKAKLSAAAAGRLEEGMGRLAAGTPLGKETDPVRDGVHELRVDVDKHWYRLLYGHHKGRYIALVFVVKKRNKLDKAWIDSAVKRLKGHKKLHP